MKQIRILALAIAVIFFAASCSKDKGEKPTGGGSIEGKWNMTHIKTIEPNNEVYNYDAEAGDYMKFNADGTMFTKVGDYEKTEDYQVVDNNHIKKGGFDADIQLSSNKLVLHVPPHDGQPEDLTYTLSK